MRVAAYQAPLLPNGSMDAIELIREQVAQCESQAVSFLCCPEGVLGGLADYSLAPQALAIGVEDGRLERLVSPLASASVTTILGFTERGPEGRLYNSAAVIHRGALAGVYRKQHPAINRSVYSAGVDAPVFSIGALTFGVVICFDSVFDEPAATLAHRGARVLFVPTNNGMPPAKGGPELVAEARAVDVRLATKYHVAVVRADVAGRAQELVSHGSSGIVSAGGRVLRAAGGAVPELLVAEI